MNKPIFHKHRGSNPCGKLAMYFIKEHPEFVDEVSLPGGGRPPVGLFECPRCGGALAYRLRRAKEDGVLYATFAILEERE